MVFDGHQVIALLIAEVTVLGPVIYFFNRLSAKLKTQTDSLEKMGAQQEEQTKILTALVRDHEVIMDRFRSVLTRGDDSLALQREMVTQLTEANAEHRLLMKSFENLGERILERLPIAK